MTACGAWGLNLAALIDSGEGSLAHQHAV